MTEDTLARFQAALKNDESFRKEFLAANSLVEAAGVATRRGLEITVDDLKILDGGSTTLDEGHLSDAELQKVGGGTVVQRMFEMYSKVMANAHEMKKALIGNFPR